MLNKFNVTKVNENYFTQKRSAFVEDIYVQSLDILKKVPGYLNYTLFIYLLETVVLHLLDKSLINLLWKTRYKWSWPQEQHSKHHY